MKKTPPPNLQYEAQSGVFVFHPEGLVIGVDEVGRGCAAGEVVAAAVAFQSNFLAEHFDQKTGEWKNTQHSLFQVHDSKLLTEKKREELAQLIQKEAWAYAIADASVEEIDSLNILWASHLAMERAVFKVEENLHRLANQVWVDGNRVPEQIQERAKCLVKGDQKSFLIACASILAKVDRDQRMKLLHEQDSRFDYAKHKGYPTPKHIEAIRNFGPTKQHRQAWLKNI